MKAIVSLLMSVALLVFVSGCRQGAEDGARLPNLVLILADDLGWSDLSCQGSGYYVTPRIDELAENGMRFTNAYSNGPNCAPTRASLMTGIYSPRHRVFTVGDPWRGPHETRRLIPPPNTTSLSIEVPTIAEMLSEAGYVTASIGKWHLGTPGESGPIEHGFQMNVAGTAAGHPPTYFSPYRIATLPDGPEGEYLTDRLTEEALSFIRRYQDQPFFLYLPHFAVHNPVEAPEAAIEQYRGKDGWHGQTNPAYAAMIERLDTSVGLIVDTLHELDLLDNTLVVFTSDNGGLGGYESAGLPGSRRNTDNYPLKGGKGQLYEGGIRVPFLAMWPGRIPPGSVSDTPIITLDLFPTLLQAANRGAALPAECDGRDLLPVLTGKGGLERDSLYWYFPAYLGAYGRSGVRTSPAAAVRRGFFKLIWFFESNQTELYDLSADIGERKDLSSERPELARELHEELLSWMAETGAPRLTANPEYVGQ